tara:strand:- start:2772 stop:3812 length:1041 start_codon:yes stop_codon:yes gene_type:complete
MNLSYRKKRAGFSLIELMVSMGILTVLMYMLTILLDNVQKVWVSSESRIGQFREARVAFDLLSKNLGQASLNTYFDLEDEDGDGLVDQYYRTSELHFVTMDALGLDVTGEQKPVGHAVFFQAPLGFSTAYRNLNNLFNGRGYFVAFGGDKNFRPSFVKSAERYRFRLMEFRPPAEANQIFEDGGTERAAGEPQEFTEWFRQAATLPGDSGGFEDHLNPLAENIVTLIISPRDSLIGSSGGRKNTFSEIAPNYKYDSNDSSDGFAGFAQQVPPLVRVTMVAIDEVSAIRLEDGDQLPEVIPSELFRVTSNYEKDIAALSIELDEKRINYKIFSSMVMLRSAKWSDNN